MVCSVEYGAGCFILGSGEINISGAVAGYINIAPSVKLSLKEDDNE